jgi:hypothetical protein
MIINCPSTVNTWAISIGVSPVIQTALVEINKESIIDNETPSCVERGSISNSVPTEIIRANAVAINNEGLVRLLMSPITPLEISRRENNPSTVISKSW